jgi:hypothetical protein
MVLYLLIGNILGKGISKNAELQLTNKIQLQYLFMNLKPGSSAEETYKYMATFFSVPTSLFQTKASPSLCKPIKESVRLPFVKKKKSSTVVQVSIVNRITIRKDNKS